MRWVIFRGARFVYFLSGLDAAGVIQRPALCQLTLTAIFRRWPLARVQMVSLALVAISHRLLMPYVMPQGKSCLISSLANWALRMGTTVAGTCMLLLGSSTGNIAPFFTSGTMGRPVREVRGGELRPLLCAYRAVSGSALRLRRPAVPTVMLEYRRNAPTRARSST